MPKVFKRNLTNNCKRRTGITRILTDTPVRNDIQKEKKKREQGKDKPKPRMLWKKRFKAMTKPTSQNSSDEEDNTMPSPLANIADSECGLSDEKIAEGNFVIVNIKGTSRAVPYIAI